MYELDAVKQQMRENYLTDVVIALQDHKRYWSDLPRTSARVLEQLLEDAGYSNVLLYELPPHWECVFDISGVDPGELKIIAEERVRLKEIDTPEEQLPI